MSKKKDDNGLDFGYGFGHKKNSRLSKSFNLDILDLVQLAAAYPDSGNNQNLFVHCDDCDTYMTFVEGTSGDLSGYYVCPICGSKVKESTPYHQLERENEKYLKDNELDGYGDDDDYDEYYGYLG